MDSQQSPTGPLAHQHHYGVPARPQPNGQMPLPLTQQPPQQQQQQQQQGKPTAQWLATANEQVYLQLGSYAEAVGDLDGATMCYERAMHFNQWSIPAMLAISSILRTKDQFTAAVEYLRQILKLEANNGDVWSSLGHCYLMMDDLQQAYSAYQQALYHLPDPKEPKLWYGIGILYDRYGSLEHAEEAFSQVMRMEPGFEKANEIYFRLGIIYKQQQKFHSSLECFQYIVKDPPRPLSEEDIWFQIGHVHEQQKDYDAAKRAYTRVLERDPTHAKVLQQLGWLHHQQSTSFTSQEQAIAYLEKSVASDQTDAQSWYLLGRCYMSQQKYPKAYEAYQQAVYRDGRNPTFWCSIGVLYYQINQYRDALDAYSRAIRLNPNISEVWYDLGTLYESCNNQTSDALDAYTRAADLDPANAHIKARLALLKGLPASGLPTQSGAPLPLPQDVHPQAYQPNALGGPPGPQWGAHQTAPPPGPAPPPLAPGNNWGSGSRLADLQNPQMQPQLVNPYDQRGDRMPAPPQGQQIPPPRQPSPPHPDHRYQEQPQRPPPPPHRGFQSPSPKGHDAAPSHYPSAPHQAQHLPPHQVHTPTHEQPRPTYTPQHSNGPTNGQPPNGVGPLPPYARQPEQPPEIRPIVQGSVPSPNSQYYEHHPNPSNPNIANGAPPPSAAQTAADAAAREREERPSSAVPKRLREWEDEPNGNPMKKLATENNRAKMEDVKLQRPSPPERVETPIGKSPSDARRQDEPRPMSACKPSEAAHHPPALPLNRPNSTQPSPRTSAPPQEEQQRAGPLPPPPPAAAPPAPTPVLEPAARKMDVDDNYDDSGDEEKRSSTKQESRKSTPKPANGTSTTAFATPIEQVA